MRLKTLDGVTNLIERLEGNMVSDWNVYVCFRHAQAQAKGKPYRLPKDWETFKETRMSANNKRFLNQTVLFLNTKWHNVNLNDFMETGFELWKNFSYHQFQDTKVIELYKRKAQVHMRKLRIDKETVLTSLKYIKKYMSDKENLNGYSKLETYCKLKDGHCHIVYQDYIQGKIDNLTMTFLLFKRYLKLGDTERGNMTVFMNNYRELVESMKELQKFIEKAELSI